MCYHHTPLQTLASSLLERVFDASAYYLLILHSGQQPLLRRINKEFAAQCVTGTGFMLRALGAQREHNSLVLLRMLEKVAPRSWHRELGHEDRKPRGRSPFSTVLTRVKVGAVTSKP